MEEMKTIPERISYIGRRMFERKLTDMAGGNISARDSDRVYMTPRYSGAHSHWQLDPADIVSFALGSAEIVEDPRFSREGLMHLAIYKNFPDAKAIIHAHPLHVLPFAAALKPIEPVLEGTRKFGVIDLVKAAPTHTTELAENVVAGLKGKIPLIQKTAAAVLIPYHGIVVVSRDLLVTIDTLERIDWNAWCIIANRSLL